MNVNVAVAIAAAVALAGCSGAPLPDDLARAQRLEEARRDDEALAAYQAAASRCPAPGARRFDDCGLAAFRAAQLLERLGRDREAAAAYLAVRDKSLDGRLIARALVRAAELDAGPLRQREPALALCREVVRTWPDEVPAEDALRLLARLRTGDPGLAAELDAIAAAQRDHAVSGPALLLSARLAGQAGDVDGAVARYDELWRRFPRGPLRDDAAYAAARLLRRAGRPAEAAARLERLEGTFRRAYIVGDYNAPLLDEGGLLLGEIYLDDLRRPQQAIAAWQGLLKRQPSSHLADDALYDMARAALARHEPPSPADVQEACADLRRLLREHPDGNMARRAREESGRLGCAGP